MMIFSGISSTGTVSLMTGIGTMHTPIIMIRGTMIHGITIPGTTAHGIMIPGIMIHGIMLLITHTAIIMGLVPVIPVRYV